MNNTESVTETVRADRGYAVYRYYGFEPSKKKIKSPFREEKTPSFNIHLDGYFKDFGDDRYKGDAFKFIMSVEKCDFKEACKIAESIYGIDGSKPISITKPKPLPKPQEKAIGYLPYSILEKALRASKSRYSECHFLQGLRNVWKFDPATIQRIISEYKVCVSDGKEALAFLMWIQTGTFAK